MSSGHPVSLSVSPLTSAIRSRATNPCNLLVCRMSNQRSWEQTRQEVRKSPAVAAPGSDARPAVSPYRGPVGGELSLKPLSVLDLDLLTLCLAIRVIIIDFAAIGKLTRIILGCRQAGRQADYHTAPSRYLTTTKYSIDTLLKRRIRVQDFT